jgi:hypothetical protein
MGPFLSISIENWRRAAALGGKKGKTMHRSTLFAVVLGCSLMAVPPALQAECPTGDYVVSVEPGRNGQPIAKNRLLAAAPGFRIIGFSQPSIGVLTESADSFLYKPSSRFWTQGTDSFTVHLAPLPGRVTQDSIRARTVFLASALGPWKSLAESFEGDLTSNWVSQDTAGHIQLFGQGALCGDQSLKIVARPAGSWISALLGEYRDDGDTGGGQQGSGAQATFRPPGSGPPGGPPGNFHTPYEMAFFSAGAIAQPDYRLWLRDGNGSLEVRAEVPGVASTPWLPISRSVHRFQLTSWLGSANGDRRGGVFFWLDGTLAAELTAPIGGSHNEFRFGSLESDELSEAGLEIALDDVYLFLTDLRQPSHLCLAADGFEGGQIGDEWRVPSGFSATAAAALDGSSGLEVRVDEATQLMKVPTPTQNGRYGLRFRFDPNTVNFSAGGQLLLFEALAAKGGRSIALLLEAGHSGYRLRALSEDDGGSVLFTPLLPLSDGPHTLSVDWHRAAGEGAPTGSLRLWIDGALAGELTGLTNAGQEIVEAYLGALLLEGAADGTVYFDQFEAWRGVLP